MPVCVCECVCVCVYAERDSVCVCACVCACPIVGYAVLIRLAWAAIGPSTPRVPCRASTGGYHSIPSQGHGQDASAADLPAAAAAARGYAQGAPGTERPYDPETASVAAEGKEETRHFRQSHCHDPEMNAEEEGRNLSSQIKTDECTAWAFLPKLLHDQLLRVAHLSVTSSVSAAACSSLRPCDPPARTNAAPS